MKKIFKNFIFLPLILAAAIAFVVYQVKSKAPVEHEQAGFPVKAVEVINIDKIPFRARAMAFGHVEPSVVLKAKSEVSGKVIYVNPKLNKGASLKKGTVVIRIEPTNFELSLSQSKAGLAGSRSSLDQLIAEEKSTKRALTIAQKNLDVELKELQRIKSLWVKRLIARSTLDKEEQVVLSLRQQVQDIQGKLESYASRKAAIRAQITQSKSQVDQSKVTLDRTEVVLPFDARIGTVYVEEGEFIPAGGLLFEALGLQEVEINAQLPTKQFRPLVSTLGNGKGIKNTSISLKDPASIAKAIQNLHLEAKVRLVGDSSDAAVWDGKLDRLSESVDPTRDTIGLVITVKDPYESVIPGKRPPLLKGMYTSVELFSPARPTIVVPRKAVHQGRVYLASEKNTLEIVPVYVQFMQGDLIVLDDKKDAHLTGKRVIISDVIPVMEGLPLKAIVAESYMQKLTQNALGKVTLDKQRMGEKK